MRGRRTSCAYTAPGSVCRHDLLHRVRDDAAQLARERLGAQGRLRMARGAEPTQLSASEAGEVAAHGNHPPSVMPTRGVGCSAARRRDAWASQAGNIRHELRHDLLQAQGRRGAVRARGLRAPLWGRTVRLQHMRWSSAGERRCRKSPTTASPSLRKTTLPTAAPAETSVPVSACATPPSRGAGTASAPPHRPAVGGSLRPPGGNISGHPNCGLRRSRKRAGLLQHVGRLRDGLLLMHRREDPVKGRRERNAPLSVRSRRRRALAEQGPVVGRRPMPLALALALLAPIAKARAPPRLPAAFAAAPRVKAPTVAATAPHCSEVGPGAQAHSVGSLLAVAAAAAHARGCTAHGAGTPGHLCDASAAKTIARCEAWALVDPLASMHQPSYACNGGRAVLTAIAEGLRGPLALRPAATRLRACIKRHAERARQRVPSHVRSAGAHNPWRIPGAQQRQRKVRRVTARICVGQLHL